MKPILRDGMIKMCDEESVKIIYTVKMAKKIIYTVKIVMKTGAKVMV